MGGWPPASNVPSAILTPWSSATTRSDTPADHVHVVLDDQDRHPELVAQAGDQLGHLVGLLRVHAGGGLVEQQQLRLGGERAGDLQPAPVGVREAVGRLIPPVTGQALPEEGQHLLGAGAHLSLLAPGAGQAKDRLERSGPRPAVRRRHHVLDHRHVEEQAQALERARDPQPGDLVGLAAEQRLPEEAHVAFSRLVDSGDHVEHGRLARAVGPDHADHFALVDAQLELGQRAQAAEGQGDAIELEDGRRRH